MNFLAFSYAGMHYIQCVESFTYLGAVIHSTCSSEPEIRRRSAKTRTVIRSLDRHLWRSRIATSTKLSFYTSVQCLHFTDVVRITMLDGQERRCTANSGFCPSDIRSFEELLKTSDEQLFFKIIHNRHHVLYKHLPPPSSASQNYDLRPRIHNRQLPDHPGHLTDCNFFIRLLYNEIY